MKKLFSILLVVAVLAVGMEIEAKSSKTKHKSKSSASALTIKKGEVHHYGDYLTTQTFSVKKGSDNGVTIEYPISGNPELVKKIRGFIRDMINGEYKGSLETPDGLMRSVMKGLGRNYEYIAKVTVPYSNSKLITFYSTGYEYAGGAHGASWDVGRTFIVENAEEFDSSMLPAWNVMYPYILQALAEDRETSISDLKDQFYEEDSLEEYGNISIVKDGIQIVYGEYEIGPYSSGIFKGVIPVDKVYNLLPAKTQKLLK